MPDDSIMDFVDNEESLYNRKLAVFDKWIAQGDDLKKSVMRIKALHLGGVFATDIRESGLLTGQGRYKAADIRQFADEMLAEFEEYRDYKIKAAAERKRAPEAPKPMTPEEIEWAKICDDNAKRIGIDLLKSLVPASPEKVRRALETNDPHLNTIPLRDWDAAVAAIRAPGLSLSEKVCALKHVARWYYV
jgi:hypothetical protein